MPVIGVFLGAQIGIFLYEALIRLFSVVLLVHVQVLCRSGVGTL